MIASLLYFLLLLILGSLFIFYLAVEEKVRRHSPLLLITFTVNYTIRGYLVSLNESFDLFGSKLAGGLSIDAFNALFLGTGDRVHETFLPQMLVNFLAFSFFGAERVHVVITNAFLTSLAGPIIFVVLYTLWNWRVALIGMVSAYIYLGAVNFSLFGLRDPIIYFSVLIYVLATLRLLKCSRLSARLLYLAIITVALVFILFSRIELLPIISVIPAWLIFTRVIKIIEHFKSKAARVLLLLILISVTGVTFGALTLSAYRIVLAQIGISTLVSPLEIAGFYADARYQRQFNEYYDGGGAILHPSLYAKVPPILRVPIQATGIVILPFPWYINSFQELLAFLDSSFIVVCLVTVVRRWRRLKQDRKIVFALILSYLVGVIIMGFIVNNTGNAFRMRLSLFPFLLVAFALSSGKVSAYKRALDKPSHVSARNEVIT